MLNLSSTSPRDSIEITLTGDRIVESRVTREVPEEVLAAGPLAVHRFLDFLDRTGHTSISPVVENIELIDCDLAA